MQCDIWVKDKRTGKVHKVGTDPHDSIWVSREGELHYRNMQNGEGCCGKSSLDTNCEYEFVPSDGGKLFIRRGEK